MRGPDAGPPQDEDSTEGKPIFIVRASDNVYSYFMFIGPTEEKRKEKKRADLSNETNWDVDISSWIEVFVRSVGGAAEAKRLLRPLIAYQQEGARAVQNATTT